MGAKKVLAAVLEHGFAAVKSMSARRDGLDAAPHLRTGTAGEDAAFFHLLRNGYTVVARRWCSGRVPGDVDLIAWSGELLCMFEVKTRTAHDLNPAESAVNESKRHNLRRLARAYVRQLPGPQAPQVRFDIVSVYLVPGSKPEILHFENAFGWNPRYED